MEANNIKAMREALLRILGIADHLQTRFAIPKFASEEILELKQVAESALAAPPRNCDIGNALEQVSRHRIWCKCGGACAVSCKMCFAKWAQMRYEEGVANGK